MIIGALLWDVLQHFLMYGFGYGAKDIRIIIDENNVVYVWKEDREVCSYSTGTDDPEILIEAAIADIIDNTNLFE